MNQSKSFFAAIFLVVFLCVGCVAPQTAVKPSAPTAQVEVLANGVSLSSSKVKNGGVLAIHVSAQNDSALKPQGVFEYRRENKDGKLENKSLKLLFFKDKDLGATTYSALVGIDYDIELGKKSILLTMPNGEKKEIQFEVISGGYPSETLKVAQDKVVPPAKYEKRIVREMKLLNAVYRESADTRYWSGAFQLPMSSKITSTYGGRRVYNGIKKNFHAGTDFKAAIGSPIFAPADGKVVLAQDLYFSGNTVIIDHGHSLFSIYMHMSKFNVRVGKTVKAGEQLGLSGKTGRVSGPHLHWGVQLQGVKVDPIELTRGEIMK